MSSVHVPILILKSYILTIIESIIKKLLLPMKKYNWQGKNPRKEKTGKFQNNYFYFKTAWTILKNEGHHKIIDIASSGKIVFPYEKFDDFRSLNVKSEKGIFKARMRSIRNLSRKSLLMRIINTWLWKYNIFLI